MGQSPCDLVDVQLQHNKQRVTIPFEPMQGAKEERSAVHALREVARTKNRRWSTGEANASPWFMNQGNGIYMYI